MSAPIFVPKNATSSLRLLERENVAGQHQYRLTEEAKGTTHQGLEVYGIAASFGEQLRPGTRWGTVDPITRAFKTKTGQTVDVLLSVGGEITSTGITVYLQPSLTLAGKMVREEIKSLTDSKQLPDFSKYKMHVLAAYELGFKGNHPENRVREGTKEYDRMLSALNVLAGETLPYEVKSFRIDDNIRQVAPNARTNIYGLLKDQYKNLVEMEARVAQRSAETGIDFKALLDTFRTAKMA